MGRSRRIADFSTVLGVVAPPDARLGPKTVATAGALLGSNQSILTIPNAVEKYGNARSTVVHLVLPCNSGMFGAPESEH